MWQSIINRPPKCARAIPSYRKSHDTESMSQIGKCISVRFSIKRGYCWPKMQVFLNRAWASSYLDSVWHHPHRLNTIRNIFGRGLFSHVGFVLLQCLRRIPIADVRCFQSGGDTAEPRGLTSCTTDTCPRVFIPACTRLFAPACRMH